MRCIDGRWKLDLTNNRPQSWVNIDILTTIAARWFHWLAILSSLCQSTVDIVSMFECEGSWGLQVVTQDHQETLITRTLPETQWTQFTQFIELFVQQDPTPSPPHRVDSIIGIYSGQWKNKLSYKDSVSVNVWREWTGGINTVRALLQEAPLSVLWFWASSCCL